MTTRTSNAALQERTDQQHAQVMLILARMERTLERCLADSDARRSGERSGEEVQC